jgi:hypothetical protein
MGCSQNISRCCVSAFCQTLIRRTRPPVVTPRVAVDGCYAVFIWANLQTLVPKFSQIKEGYVHFEALLSGILRTRCFKTTSRTREFASGEGCRTTSISTYVSSKNDALPNAIMVPCSRSHPLAVNLLHILHKYFYSASPLLLLYHFPIDLQV